MAKQEIKTGNPGLDKYLADTGLGQPAEVDETVDETIDETVDETVDEEVDEEVDETLEIDEEASEEDESDEESEEDEGDDEEEEFVIELEDDEEETKTTTNTEVYSELSETLQEDIKSKEDVVNVFSKLRKEKEDLTERLTTVEQRSSNIPDTLQKAIEISEQGGDYLGYLDINSQRAYVERTDSKELYTNYLAEQPVFKNAEDSVEALRDYIDGENPTKFSIEAESYKQSLLKQVDDEITRRNVDAAEKKRRSFEAAQQAIDKLDNVYGIKVSTRAKKNLVKEFETGEFTNRLLYDSDGNPDYTKMATLRFLYDNVEKLMDVVRTSAKNATKRGMIDSVANKSQRKGQKAKTKSSTKPQTNAEKAIEILKQTGGMRT